MGEKMIKTFGRSTLRMSWPPVRAASAVERPALLLLLLDGLQQQVRVPEQARLGPLVGRLLAAAASPVRAIQWPVPYASGIRVPAVAPSGGRASNHGRRYRTTPPEPL
jgi:hypothetical protein